MYTLWVYNRTGRTLNQLIHNIRKEPFTFESVADAHDWAFHNPDTVPHGYRILEHTA